MDQQKDDTNKTDDRQEMKRAKKSRYKQDKQPLSIWWTTDDTGDRTMADAKNITLYFEFARRSGQLLPEAAAEFNKLTSLSPLPRFTIPIWLYFA